MQSEGGLLLLEGMREREVQVIAHLVLERRLPEDSPLLVHAQLAFNQVALEQDEEPLVRSESPLHQV